jgi:hypothetical protein
MADDVVIGCESTALIQKSVITQPGFYGDSNNKASTSDFGKAVNICANLVGAASVLASRTAPPNYTRTHANYILTNVEKEAIRIKCIELSLLGFIPYDVLEKFFYILACIDNISDLLFVADVIGVPDLGDTRYIRNIRDICLIPDIYKVAFLANAVSAVIQAFANRFNAVQTKTDKHDNLLNKVAAIAGAAGALAGPLLEQTGGLAIGNFMSELLTGTRLTTQQIARNPSLTPPSYQGKAFFGEGSTAIPAVDQLFCRRIGAFNKEQGSNGCVSFGMQNFASFGGALSLGSVVSKMIIGTTSLPSPSTFIGQSMGGIISNVASVLNVATTATLELRRADNAIPFLIGLASGIAESERCPFNTKHFTGGWQLASSVGNDVQKQQPLYLEACRTSL